MNLATVRKSASIKSGKKPATASRGSSSTGIRAKSLRSLAYELIEEKIANLELTPGSAISEIEISNQLGIGRTPVREALQRLAQEHLVQILPQRGILVSEIDIKKQLRLLEARREVERLVVRCAARRANPEERKRFAELAKAFQASGKNNNDVLFMRADKEFNDLSISASRNEFAAGAMGLMHGLARRFWFLHFKQFNDLLRIAKLHATLSQAIADRDETAAGQSLDRLIDYIEDFTKSTISLEF